MPAGGEESHSLDRTPDVNQAGRILVVEDDVQVLTGIREILEREGYIVITALNGVEGLQSLEAHPDVPDVIIANVLMPEMDGFTVIRELRRKPEYQPIPIIIETAHPEHKNAALEVGATLFLLLPYHARELLIMVSCVLPEK